MQVWRVLSMAIVLYELVGIEDRRFSSNSWRTRMALAHKGLDAEIRAIHFTDIGKLWGNRFKTVPVIEDGPVVLNESWKIALYLDDTYPQKPSLFGGAASRELTFFVQSWVDAVLTSGARNFLILDIHDHLTPPDQKYFRASREKRFGKTLEELSSDRERDVVAFRASLEPLRRTLSERLFLGGSAPAYADYVVFGTFQWARSISRFRLVEADDPIAKWFERCLDLHGGIGRKSPGYT
jgi:glutathione S-transferase